jgi:hypothetical protein
MLLSNEKKEDVNYATDKKSCPNCGRKKKKKLPTPWRKVSQTGARFYIFYMFLLKKKEKKIAYISLPS